jgi:hypothetical protein
MALSVSHLSRPIGGDLWLGRQLVPKATLGKKVFLFVILSDESLASNTRFIAQNDK